MATGRFHADVTVEGIPVSLSTPRVDGAVDGVTSSSPLDAHNRHLQSCWDRTICKELDWPDTYSNVAVRIIHWEEHLDQDLNCGKEVEKLKDIFENGYNYECKVVKLTDQSSARPQTQLRAAVGNLANEGEGDCRTHLLILYYTGHGFCDETSSGEKILTISGRRSPHEANNSTARHKPEADWTPVMKDLEEVEADVLVVLDTCFAGTVFKGGQSVRCFEVMAAARADEVTSPPGDHSYTHAFVEALQDHLDGGCASPLTMRVLNQEIMRRRGMKALHWDHAVNDSSRCIKLAPIVEEVKRNPPAHSTDVAHLTVRFAFCASTDVDTSAVQTLAAGVARAVRQSRLPIRAVDWLGVKRLQSRWTKALSMAKIIGGIRKRRPEDEAEELETPTDKRQRLEHSLTAFMSPSPSAVSGYTSPKPGQ